MNPKNIAETSLETAAFLSLEKCRLFTAEHMRGLKLSIISCR